MARPRDQRSGPNRTDKERIRSAREVDGRKQLSPSDRLGLCGSPPLHNSLPSRHTHNLQCGRALILLHPSHLPSRERLTRAVGGLTCQSAAEGSGSSPTMLCALPPCLLPPPYRCLGDGWNLSPPSRPRGIFPPGKGRALPEGFLRGRGGRLGLRPPVGPPVRSAAIDTDMSDLTGRSLPLTPSPLLASGLGDGGGEAVPNGPASSRASGDASVVCKDYVCRLHRLGRQNDCREGGHGTRDTPDRVLFRSTRIALELVLCGDHDGRGYSRLEFVFVPGSSLSR